MDYVSLSPGALLSPVPAVLVSCADENGRPNALTVAWAGTVCSDPPMVSVSIRPSRFTCVLVEESGEFVVCLTDFTLTVTGVRADAAQVMRGGIDTALFDPRTMESRRVPGLFCTGEMLDVDGDCGGFNLMFAFLSGVAAGRAASA